MMRSQIFSTMQRRTQATDRAYEEVDAPAPTAPYALKRAWEDDGGPCPPWQEDC